MEHSYHTFGLSKLGFRRPLFARWFAEPRHQRHSNLYHYGPLMRSSGLAADGLMPKKHGELLFDV